MALDPSWLKALASDDGTPLAQGRSVRPIYGEHLLALHREQIQRRKNAPQTGDLVLDAEIFSDQRNLSDVLDDDIDGVLPYLRLGHIGEGGMGIVHLGRQRSTGRAVAIKALHAAMRHQALQAAFQQECRITAALEHPNVPAVYDAGADFMVMKRLTGQSLERRLLDGMAKEDMAGAIEALLKVCDALAFAHASGVVHRDLKGENIMIGDYGEVWLMDWGLAASFAPDREGVWLSPAVTTRQQMCAGTPVCVAPEVALADPEAIGSGIDIFMLGALLYRILCGHYPYEAADATASVRLAGRRDLQGLLIRAPGSPFRLVQAAERAMAWDPVDRGTVTDFASDLRTWMRSSGATAEAKSLAGKAAELLALASEAHARPTERYRKLSQAINSADRALQLAPELRDAHEVSKRVRTAFAQVAEEAGDRTLADLIRRGFAPPTGG